jgi:hypothetical protein
VRQGQRLNAMVFRGSRSCSCPKDYQGFWKKIASVIGRQWPSVTFSAWSRCRTREVNRKPPPGNAASGGALM